MIFVDYVIVLSIRHYFITSYLLFLHLTLYMSPNFVLTQLTVTVVHFLFFSAYTFQCFFVKPITRPCWKVIHEILE